MVRNNLNYSITIKRVASNQDGTFGVMLDANNVPFALTVEPENKNNEPSVSCIPAGVYYAKLRRKETSRRTYDTWELIDVPGRSNIQIHIGSTEDSSEGCIIVGESFEPYKGKTAGVMQSTHAYNELMEKTKEVDSLIINILWC